MKKIMVVGSLNMDIVINTKSIPRVGETVLGNNYKYNPGGKGANQACVVAKLGEKAVMFGCVGADDFGKELLRNLEAEGVDTGNIEILENIQTGTAFICTDSAAANSIITVPGANEKCDARYIEKYLDRIADYDCVLLQMEIPHETVYKVIRAANEYGTIVILDPAPAPKYIPDDVFLKVDIITPNEIELAALCGIERIEKMDQTVEAANSLVAKGFRNVIVTLGEKGALWAFPGGYCHIPVRKVKAVDTTAAGDCFNGALAVGICKGMQMKKAIENASFIASISVMRHGAQMSIPTLAEVEEEIKLEHLRNLNGVT
jgi:ribokinase